MTIDPSAALMRTHLPEYTSVLGQSVRAADSSLHLHGGSGDLLDTTHFDTVRFPPIPTALKDYIEAAGRGDAAYSRYRGHVSTRAAVAGAVTILTGTEIDPEREIALVTGTQAGLFATVASLINPGDVVAVADPEYLFVERMLRFVGARVERVPYVTTATGLELDTERLEQLAAQGVVAFVTSNPSNPTGTVYRHRTLQTIAELACRYDFLAVVDELYCRLVYGETPFEHLMTFPGMRHRTVTLMGGSKTESLTGFRVGVVVAPAEMIDAVEQMTALMSLRAPAYSQYAMLSWVHDDAEFVAQRVAELRELRDRTAQMLSTVPGVAVTAGEGTAYLWPDVSSLGATAVTVAQALRDGAGVIVSPGYQFGPSGMGRFRLCYAREESTWYPAVERIGRVLAGLGSGC